MGNGHACEILGIGKIRFCMMDPPLICLMFRYVLNLIHSIILLEALESTSLEITFVGGAIKICLCALVEMTGTWCNNLYFRVQLKVEYPPLLGRL